MDKGWMKYSKQYFIGLLVIFAAVVVFLNIFLELAKTDEKDIYLSDVAGEPLQWEYEILSDGKASVITPEFDSDDFLIYPVESMQALKITRTMREDIPDAELELSLFSERLTEIYLDEEILYTQIPDGVRNGEGFLILDDEEIEKWAVSNEEYPYGKSIRMELPQNSCGRKLTIITYYGGNIQSYYPSYPYLGTNESRYAAYVADMVMPVVSLILCAVCVLLLLVVFVMDISNGRANLRILLLILYFILVFVQTLENPTLSVVGDIDEKVLIQVFSNWSMIPLYVFLTLYLTGWRRWIALGSTAVWTVSTGMEMFFNRKVYGIWSDILGRKAFLLTLIFVGIFLVEYLIFRRAEINKKKVLIYLGFSVMVGLVCVVYEANRSCDGKVLKYILDTCALVFDGYYISLMSLVQNTCSSMAVIILVLEFFRRSEETKTMVTVLEERGKAAMEGYNRMLEAEESTNSLRHEMAHHMTALMGFIKEGENLRANNYIASVVRELNELPVFRYSENILVNMIAGTYLDRAKKMGIEVKSSISIPKELGILDEDLSVFLTNMFQNALEACERADSGQERHISVKIRAHEKFLSIGCVNTMPLLHENNLSDAENFKWKEDRMHGYGLKAMKNIAEKYGSILKVDQTSTEFSVKTSLQMSEAAG